MSSYEEVKKEAIHIMSVVGMLRGMISGSPLNPDLISKYEKLRDDTRLHVEGFLGDNYNPEHDIKSF